MSIALTYSVIRTSFNEVSNPLRKIRDQFQDRMIAQEQRIAEMDRELQEKEKLLNESRKAKPQNGDSTKFS